MAEHNTPIVVVAYNRPRSLLRLLSSLAQASYPTSNIDLIISIDKAENNQDIVKISNDFIWKNGDKKIEYQETNLGLRAHILKCGNLSLKYGSVLILEDDLYVSPNFYTYTIAVLEFCKDKNQIGGISLYNHMLNVHNRDNFIALEDGFDNWYFQFASSWGQAWNKNQWSGFMDWYNQNPNINEMDSVPSYVRSWSEKSWLKYNISYLVEKNKYFFYPKTSLTTNFSDAGTHVGQDSTVYQVPLSFGKKTKYIFSSFEESNSIYDSFYENILIAKTLNISPLDLCVNLYGSKFFLDKQYVITSKVLDYKVIKSFGCSLRPIDANIFENIDGKEFFLYNTKIIESNQYKKEVGRKLSYNVKYISFKDVKALMFNMMSRKIKRGVGRIKSIFR